MNGSLSLEQDHLPSLHIQGLKAAGRETHHFFVDDYRIPSEDLVRGAEKLGPCSPNRRASRMSAARFGGLPDRCRWCLPTYPGRVSTHRIHPSLSESRIGGSHAAVPGLIAVVL